MPSGEPLTRWRRTTPCLRAVGIGKVYWSTPRGERSSDVAGEDAENEGVGRMLSEASPYRNAGRFQLRPS